MKLHAARIPLPVITATGEAPHQESTQQPWLQPAAKLLDHYTVAVFWGTVQKVLCATILIIMMQLCLPATTNAQNAIQPATSLRIVPSDIAAQTNKAPFRDSRMHGVALTVRGKCDCSEDGVTFTTVERGDAIEPGTIIRTGKEGEMDLFFRRSRTTVRLQAGTNLKLDEVAAIVKEGHLAEHIILDLRSGRIFTVVCSAGVGVKLEISNSAGRSVVEGHGMGRYVITADGTHITAVGSVIPLKLMGENGITTIAAGQQFTKQDGKLLPLSRTSYDKDLVQLDKLQGATDRPAAGGPSPMP
jgi:hypothetical protein